MRPDVSVGSVTTGGLVEPRADWTEQARAKLLAALRAQQAARGGNVSDHGQAEFAARRRSGDDRRSGAASLCGRQLDRPAQIFGRLSADQARQGPRLDARRGCCRARPPHRLRLCAVPLCRGQLRLDRAGRRSRFSALPAVSSAFARPNIGGGGQFAYASLADLRTGEVVWFNVVSARSQIAGIKMGDIRTDEGAAQTGRAAARPDEARPQRAAARRERNDRGPVTANAAGRRGGARCRRLPPASPMPASCPGTWFR